MTTFTYTGSNGWAPRVAVSMKCGITFPNRRYLYRGDPLKITADMVNAEDNVFSRADERVLLTRLRQFMDDDSASIPNVAVTETPGTKTGTGDGSLIIGTINRDGEVAYGAFSEDIVFTCTRDGQANGRATAMFAYRGEEAIRDRMSREWPGGSGCTGSLASSNSGAAGNHLRDSGFEDFTANDPDHWTIGVGSAGSTVYGDTSNELRGATCLRFAGDVGGTLMKVSQPFGSVSNGNRYLLKPWTVYCIAVATKVSAAPAAGVLKIEIVNTGNGTELSADASDGSATTLTIDLTAETTSYAWHDVVFATPKAMPISAGYQINVELTTAIDNGKSVYIDELGLYEMKELYRGGPHAVITDGATNWVEDAEYPVTIANAGAEGGWTYELRRFFPSCDDILLAVDPSPTIANSVISGA